MSSLIAKELRRAAHEARAKIAAARRASFAARTEPSCEDARVWLDRCGHDGRAYLVSREQGGVSVFVHILYGEQLLTEVSGLVAHVLQVPFWHHPPSLRFVGSDHMLERKLIKSELFSLVKWL